MRNRNHGQRPRRKAKPKPRLRQRNDWHPPCEKSDRVGMLGQVLKGIFFHWKFLEKQVRCLTQLDAQEATSFCENGSQRLGVQIYQVHNKYSSQNAQGTQYFSHNHQNFICCLTFPLLHLMWTCQDLQGVGTLQCSKLHGFDLSRADLWLL